MAPRARAAASACLVASGLLMSGLGGAIALADPGQGRSDERKGADDSTGDGSIDPNSPEVQRLKSAAMPLLMQMRDDQKREVRQLAHVIGLADVAAML